MASRSEMVVSGVLPIDRITDQRGPVGVVCQRVARAELESVYGIKLPKPAPHEDPLRPPTGAELLKAYAMSRGQMGHGGLPQETRAARQILKDFLAGKLQHYALPPSVNGTRGEGEGEEREGVSEGEGSGARVGGESRRVEEGHEERGGESGEDGEEGSEDESEGEWEEVEDEGLLESGGYEDEEEGEGSEDGEEKEESEGGLKKKVPLGSGASGASDANARPGLSQEGLPTHLRVKTSVSAPSSGAATSSGAARSAVEVSSEMLDLTDGAPKGNQPKQPRLRGNGKKAEHKLHQKAPRRKDRSWRVTNDGGGPYKI